MARSAKPHGRRPEAPRISPLPLADLSEEAAVLLEPVLMSGTTATNIFATAVRNPELLRSWLPFSRYLLNGKLPARDREIMVLRTGWRCQAEYEWGHHVGIGRNAGLSDAEVCRIKDGPGADGWSELEVALLQAADELHDDSCITDETWSVLARYYDEQQLIELTMLVGQYHLVAFLLNSLGVQREPGVPGFEPA